MAHPGVPDSAEPCVWMSAGLLTYKLCDRDFDCERCPLDAGLRGRKPRRPHLEALLAPGRDARIFPDDRLYSDGHSWVQAIGKEDGRLLRFGLDAFAAAIIGRCGEVSWYTPERALRQGETICRIDLGLGSLSLGAPLQCEVVDRNRTLQEEPGRLVTDPYAEGWIVQMIAADLSSLDGLLPADRAREKAWLDLRRFRRRVALQLLADAGGLGRTMPDGGELLADLRQMLGGPGYLDLLRELIH